MGENLNLKGLRDQSSDWDSQNIKKKNKIFNSLNRKQNKFCFQKPNNWFASLCG